MNNQRVNILGVGVSAISLNEAVAMTLQFIRERRRGYVCVTGVHGIMEAQHDERLRNTLNRSFLTTPDGVPTVWVGRWYGFRAMSRVYGPDLMISLCEKGRDDNLRHFLYGGGDGVAEALKSSLLERIPGLDIVGCYTPPFRPLLPTEEDDLITILNRCKPDVVWIGLSTPKQERFMAAYNNRLPTALMFGVGAAFDLLSGNLDEAPDWMKRTGLQWLFRLFKEPRRLWRRYLTNNPRFVFFMLLQLLGIRKRSLASQNEM